MNRNAATVLQVLLYGLIMFILILSARDRAGLQGRIAELEKQVQSCAVVKPSGITQKLGRYLGLI